MQIRPIDVSLMLDVYCTGELPKWFDKGCPEHMRTLDMLVVAKFIEPNPAGGYYVTDKFNVWWDAVVALPMPVNGWIMPTNNTL